MNEEVKQKRAKRQFDEAFRRQAVALLETSGRPLREIATELGVSHWSLRDQRDAFKKALGILAEPSGNASRS